MDAFGACSSPSVGCCSGFGPSARNTCPGMKGCSLPRTMPAISTFRHWGARCHDGFIILDVMTSFRIASSGGSSAASAGSPCGTTVSIAKASGRRSSSSREARLSLSTPRGRGRRTAGSRPANRASASSLRRRAVASCRSTLRGPTTSFRWGQGGLGFAPSGCESASPLIFHRTPRSMQESNSFNTSAGPSWNGSPSSGRLRSRRRDPEGLNGQGSPRANRQPDLAMLSEVSVAFTHQHPTAVGRLEARL